MATSFRRMAHFLMAAVLMTLLAEHGTSGCDAGYFGFRCRFKCHCLDNKSCDDDTGECASGCPDGRWGVGCLLSNDHYYDTNGGKYMGTVNHIIKDSSGQPSSFVCKPWSYSHRSDKSFPDGSKEAAKNYCRGPSKIFCYYSENKKGYCNVTKKRCPAGRFASNCVNECHCNDEDEDCQQKKGKCESGCERHFKGLTCQDKKLFLLTQTVTTYIAVGAGITVLIITAFVCKICCCTRSRRRRKHHDKTSNNREESEANDDDNEIEESEANDDDIEIEGFSCFPCME